MKTIAVISLLCLLTGCGYGGQPLLLGAWYNANDPCQSQGRPGFQAPAFCGAAQGRTLYVRDFRTGRIQSTIRQY